MERRYQHRPWMQEGMFIVGTKPKSLGEGVIVVAHSVDYESAWQYWDAHADQDWAMYRWTQGVLVKHGRKMRNERTGKVFYVPVPPDRMKSA